MAVPLLRSISPVIAAAPAAMIVLLPLGVPSILERSRPATDRGSLSRRIRAGSYIWSGNFAARRRRPSFTEGVPLPTEKAVVAAPAGLHARSAAVFVRAVTDTGLPVTISKAGAAKVDARSLL